MVEWRQSAVQGLSGTLLVGRSSGSGREEGMSDMLIRFVISNTRAIHVNQRSLPIHHTHPIHPATPHYICLPYAISTTITILCCSHTYPRQRFCDSVPQRAP